MIDPLEAVDDEPTEGNLYTTGAITSAWAERVYEHQQALIASIRHRDRNPPVAPAPNAGRPLPWKLEDLRHDRKESYTYSTNYRGVVKMEHHPDYLAYVPATRTTGRRPIGRYRTEVEAAYAVLYAMNPASRHKPNREPT